MTGVTKYSKVSYTYKRCFSCKDAKHYRNFPVIEAGRGVWCDPVGTPHSRVCSACTNRIEGNKANLQTGHRVGIDLWAKDCTNKEIDDFLENNH